MLPLPTLLSSGGLPSSSFKLRCKLQPHICLDSSLSSLAAGANSKKHALCRSRGCTYMTLGTNGHRIHSRSRSAVKLLRLSEALLLRPHTPNPPHSKKESHSLRTKSPSKSALSRQPPKALQPKPPNPKLQNSHKSKTQRPKDPFEKAPVLSAVASSARLVSSPRAEEGPSPGLGLGRYKRPHFRV